MPRGNHNICVSTRLASLLLGVCFSIGTARGLPTNDVTSTARHTEATPEVSRNTTHSYEREWVEAATPTQIKVIPSNASDDGPREYDRGWAKQPTTLSVAARAEASADTLHSYERVWVEPVTRTRVSVTTLADGLYDYEREWTESSTTTVMATASASNGFSNHHRVWMAPKVPGIRPKPVHPDVAPYKGVNQEANGTNALAKRYDLTPVKDKKGKYMYVDDWTTVIDVINATPYRWRRGHTSSYQLPNWNDDWPAYIYPGESRRVVSYRRGGDQKSDSAAEVVYHLEGTKRPMSFRLERRAGMRRHIYVHFQDQLLSYYYRFGWRVRGVPWYDLDYHPYPGGSQFILSGAEDELVTMDPERKWMSELLPYIGDFSLGEIVMPRSHHSGMSVAADALGASRANSITHTKSVAEQLQRYGIRVLDIRPILKDGVFRAGHGTKVLGSWIGMLGEKVEDIAKAVGHFQRQWPGELVIVDISAEQSGRLEHGIHPLTEKDRRRLYKLFTDNADLMELPEHEDVTRWPLNRFIALHKSATIVRVDNEWARMPEFPGAARGFVTGETFPLRHRWSEANKASRMAPDQIDTLRRERPNRHSPLFFSDWVVTQSVDDAIFPTKSITKMALPAYGALYHDLWNAISDQTYPNWIAMDHVHSTGLVAFVRSVNLCLVARRCGPLGGKVKGVDKHGDLREDIDDVDGTQVSPQKKKISGMRGKVEKGPGRAWVPPWEWHDPQPPAGLNSSVATGGWS